jgi:hypothetical protein
VETGSGCSAIAVRSFWTKASKKTKQLSYYQIARKDGPRRDKDSQPQLAKPAKFIKIA